MIIWAHSEFMRPGFAIIYTVWISLPKAQGLHGVGTVQIKKCNLNMGLQSFHISLPLLLRWLKGGYQLADLATPCRGRTCGLLTSGAAGGMAWHAYRSCPRPKSSPARKRPLQERSPNADKLAMLVYEAWTRMAYSPRMSTSCPKWAPGGRHDVPFLCSSDALVPKIFALREFLSRNLEDFMALAQHKSRRVYSIILIFIAWTRHFQSFHISLPLPRPMA